MFCLEIGVLYGTASQVSLNVKIGVQRHWRKLKPFLLCWESWGDQSNHHLQYEIFSVQGY